MLIHIWGEYGLYTRPEFAADRVSYPVPPFSTLNGLLEAFFWKRDVTWCIERVYVLSQVLYVPIMRNERMIEEGSVRTQRRSLYVKAPMDEVDAPKISIGQPVRVTLDALPGKMLPGKVRRVARCCCSPRAARRGQQLFLRHVQLLHPVRG